MHGPTQRWDQPPDPRESTVSMPRIDPSSLTGQVSEPATAAHDDGAGMELPGFGDPYALPARAPESAPADAGGSGGSSPRVVAAPAPPTTAEASVTPEVAATPRPAIASPPEPATPPPSATPELAQPEELVALETPDKPGAIGRGTIGQPPPPAVRRAAPGAAGQPQAGSIAELRGRLERLPDGHPSSPYDDAGWLKPSPTRLRQFELGLPARSLGTSAGYSERLGIDPDDDWLNDGLARPTPADPGPEAGSPRDELLPKAAPPSAPPVEERHRAETVAADTRPPRSKAGQAAAATDSVREDTVREDTVRENTVQGPATQPARAPSPGTRTAVRNGHHDSG